jgi:hypothetical protein
MSRAKLAKENLVDPALDSGDIPALEKASSVWRSIAEAEKLEAEIAVVARTVNSESLRFWIPIVAPLITALALIGTLIFQFQQFNQNNRLQKEVNEESQRREDRVSEDTQWREALTLANTKPNDGLGKVFSLTLMKSFFDSERYKKPAREIVAIQLGSIANPSVFSDNFAVLLDRTEWSNFKDLTHISRVQSAVYDRYAYEADKLEKQENQFKSIPSTPAASLSPYMSEDTFFTRDDAEANVMTASKGLIDFLRDPRHGPLPAGMQLDLSSCAIFMQDMSNMDLHGANLKLLWISRSNVSGSNFSQANLDSANIFHTNVKDADFSGVVEVSFSRWLETAWWRAKRISPKMLKYLKEKFPFSPLKEYEGDTTPSSSEYQKEVKRLEKNQ